MSYIDTKIVSINSQSATIKYNGTYLSNVYYNLGTIISRDPDIIHRQVQLLNAQIPVSFYVINSTNNLFRLKLGAGVLTDYTIPVGNYTANSLISAIKTAVGVTNFNITISPINGKLTFTYTAAIQINNTVSNSIGFVLGFASGLYNDTAFSLTAPYPLNLLGIKALQVRSGNLLMNNISSVQGGQTTLLSTIPVSATPFGMIDYKDVGNNLITIYNDTLDDLNIEIVDGESDNYIDFNNQDWCLTLVFHITRRVPQPLAVPPASNAPKPLEEPVESNQPETQQSLRLEKVEPNIEVKRQDTYLENPNLDDLNLLLGE